MTERVRVLVESAMFWRDLAEKWAKKGNQEAVINCLRHSEERWAMVDRLLNQKGAK